MNGELPDNSAKHLAVYYSEVRKVHLDDPLLGICVICQISRCPDWRNADEYLNRLDESPVSGDHQEQPPFRGSWDGWS